MHMEYMSTNVPRNAVKKNLFRQQHISYEIHTVYEYSSREFATKIRHLLHSTSDPFPNWALKHAAVTTYPTPSTTQVVLTLSSLILDFNLTCLFCPFNFTILLYNFRFE